MRKKILSLLLFLCISNYAFSQNFEFFIRTTTNNESFTIPVDGSLTYNYNVEFANPFVPSATVSYNNQIGSVTHTFGNPGIYLIRILDGSVFPRIDFSNSADNQKITAIVRWGNNPWTTMESAFENCANLILDAPDTPNLTNVTSTNKMFKNAQALRDNRAKIGEWDVSTIEDMGQMFRGCTIFNEDITNWDTSNVENMNRMFQAAVAFDQNIGNWDVSSLTSTDAIFTSAGVSTGNYDQIIIGWSTIIAPETSRPTGIRMRFDNSTYCTTGALRTALSNAPFNWTFVDSGQDCSNIAEDTFFITTWETTTANESITIPTETAVVDFAYYVDWGDGQSDNSVTGDISHTYSNPGIHTVKISGQFPRIHFDGTGDRLKIQSIEQWGNIQWFDMANAFNGCENLVLNATDAPDLRYVANLFDTFRSCRAIGNPDLNHWDVSNINEMSGVFFASNFNGNVSNWDVGNVQSFSFMFYQTPFNQNISNWNIGENISAVLSMRSMFEGNIAFNQSLSTWDFSKVQNIRDMFLNATNFNQSLANWDISSATNMSNMLNNSGLSIDNYDATLIGWATLENGETQIPSGITLGAQGLQYCSARNAKQTLENAPNNWTITDDGPECTATAFTTTWETTTANESIEIPTFGSGYNYDVDWGDGTIETNITGDATHSYTTAGMYTVKIFGDFPQINFFDTSTPNRSKIKTIEQWGNIQWSSMEFAFSGCSQLQINATDAPDLQAVTSLSHMFSGCSAMDGIDFSNWDVSTILSMERMFDNCSSLTTPNISGWNLSSLNSMNGMFFNCTVLTTVDFTGWNTSNVNNMQSMFSGAAQFNQSLADWDISNVTNMTNMLNNTAMSIENYDNTVIGWAALDSGETQIPSNIDLGAVGLQFCNSSIARKDLIYGNSWTFTDEGINCPEEDKFITVWKTTSANEKIRFQVNGDRFYTVEWGDGTISRDQFPNAEHVYAQPGTYEVKISGYIGGLRYNNLPSGTSTRLKIYEIKQWGAQQWEVMADSYYGCENLKITATDVPDLSQITNMSDMFRNCFNLEDLGGKMGTWDVSTVENFNSTFLNANTFNRNLGTWDISNATNMISMLSNSGLSSNAYDLTLVGWGNNPNTPSNINLGASGLTYCNAVSEHDYLDNDLSWTLNDAGINCPTDEPFITTWQTTTANETITIPSTSPSYFVDWGDGSITTESGSATHQYATAAIYTVKITGGFTGVQFSATGDKDKILSIEQWGAIEWGNLARGFRGCSNLVINATDVPDLSKITNINFLFGGTSSLVDNGGRIGDWDVSNIEIMGYVFEDSNFNHNINNWDVSSAKFMGFMFRNNSQFNQPLNNWKLSNDVNLFAAFQNATAFNQDLGDWDISGVTTDMGLMLDNTDMSIENYDSTLIGWATLDADETQIPVNINLGASGLNYCESATERSVLTSAPYNWTISGDQENCDANAFITTWQTTGANESITIPTFSGETYNYEIEWGDTNTDTNQTGDATHTYTNPGVYIVKIRGTFPRIYFNNDLMEDNITPRTNGSKDKIVTIEQWGPNQWTTMHRAFQGCSNLVINADDTPDFSGVTSMNIHQMFQGATNLVDNKDQIGNWNVSNVINMYATFAGCHEFNEDITSWDVSQVQNFIQTFLQARKFNQDISGWITSSATTMSTMFAGTEEFNQDISGWDVSSVEQMQYMFANTTVFNQDISGWNVAAVQRMDRMFQNAQAFNQDLSTWDISSLGTSMTFTESAEQMFSGATAFTQENYDALLIGWATDSSGTAGDGDDDIPTNITFTATSEYCEGASAKNTLTSTPYNWMITDEGPNCDFTNAFITTWQTTTADESITIPTTGSGYNYIVDWGDGTIASQLTGNATHNYTSAGTYTVQIIGDFPRIYFDNTGNTDNIQTIEQWGNNPWTTMEDAFLGCNNLVINATDIPDLSNVTSTYAMFSGNTNLVDNGGVIGSWNVSTVENISRMFRGCVNFNANINNWNTIEVREMDGVFLDCSNFNQPLHNWNTSNVTIMSNLFDGAGKFNQDIGGWDVSQVNDMIRMFEDAQEFNQNLEDWDISSISGGSSMFNMFNNSALSQENYDNILIGWTTVTTGESIPSLVTFSAGTTTYCLGEAARNILTSAPYNWTITDGGRSCDFTNAFITTWETTTANENITIPTTGSGYNYTVDWGDGTIETGFTGNATHNYASAGTYTVQVIGNFPRIYFNNGGDEDKIQSIEQWGTQEWTSMKNAFSGCEFMAINATDSPNLSQATDLSNMFSVCKNIEGANLSNWDTTTITNMSGMFGFSRFNGNISTWDVGNVTTFNGMFESASRFNQDISQWNIGEFVTGFIDMSEMFKTASRFNQSLNMWDVSKVDKMHFMFQRAFDYNQPMDNWDVSNVKFMNEMFDDARDFNQNLAAWDISNVQTFVNFLIDSGMSQENYDATLIGWATIDTGETGLKIGVRLDANATYCLGTNARNTLTSAPYNWNITDGGQSCDFTNAFITTWEMTTANEDITIPTTGSGYNFAVDWGDGTVEAGFTGDASHSYATANTYTVKIIGSFPRIYFSNASDKDKILSVEQWGTIQWTNMNGAFSGCTNLTLNATDSPDLTQVTSMYRMFRETTFFVDHQNMIGNWDVSNITSMGELFEASGFNENINNWDVRNVQSMAYMFHNNTVFNHPLNQWIPQNVSDFEHMFNGATAFNQSIGSWNINNGSSFESMFQNATAFDQDLSGWDIHNTDRLGMVNMLIGSGMSEANYDATLIGWATLEAGEIAIPVDVTLDASATYCLAENSRNILTSVPYNWNITDGGLSCSNIQLAAKIYLQGAALNPNTGEESLMRDDLRAASLLPTTSPYADGLTCNATIFNTTGPEAIVDWVWVELRDKGNSTSILHSTSALLQRDGDIVDVDGVSTLSFDANRDNYFIAIKHRNHLGIMSLEAITLNAQTTVIDFSDVSNQVTFGSNSQTTSGMQPGIVAMWAGNVNDDAVVQYSGTTPDTPNILSLVLNDPGNFLNFPTFAVSGYNVNDVNMNGSTQYSGTNPDTPFILQNVLAHPGNFLNFSTYQIIQQLPQN